MGMKAAAANTLEVYFSKDVFLTFKMHADLKMDTLRWLRDHIKRLQVMAARADKIEAKAVEQDDDTEFEQLSDRAKGLRSKGGDELDVMVEYVMRASNGWTDFYADADAEARGEVLPFEETNIARIGVIKLNKVITEFNKHYGLAEPDSGEAKGSSSPEPSQPVGKEVGSIPNSTSTTVQT